MTDEAWESLAKLKGYPSIKIMLIEKYIKEHLSIDEIARWFGCSAGTIRKFLDHSNIPVRLHRVDTSHIPDKAIIEMTVVELANKFKISKGMAWRLKNQSQSS